MKMQRKGLSTVVATVLLILITVAAAGMIGAFVIPYVKNNLTKSTECIPYNDYFKFEQNVGGKNYNCFQIDSSNAQNTLLGNSVKATQTENSDPDAIGGLNIIFTKKDGTTIVKEYNGQDSDRTSVGGLWMLGEGSRRISIPLEGDVLTYGYKIATPTSDVAKAEIVAVLRSGRQCSISDTIILDKCESSIDLKS